MLALKILGKLVLGFISFFAFIGIIRSLLLLQIPESVWWIILGIWITALVSFEVVWLRRKQKPFPRFLIHLRYAPLAILFFSIAVTLVFDAAMIEYSKYKVRSYIYSSVSPEEKIELDLHSNYRSWCGTGFSDHYASLYGETARTGSSSSDAAVRARSLRARMLVFDLPISAIEQAEQDEDAIVRKLAARFRKGEF